MREVPAVVGVGLFSLSLEGMRPVSLQGPPLTRGRRSAAERLPHRLSQYFWPMAAGRFRTRA